MGTYTLTSVYPCRAVYFDPSNSSTIQTGDNQYKNDDSLTGNITVTYWDGHIMAGTFEMDLVNESGVVVRITKGRFDATR